MAYYGVVLHDGDELLHYGIKGMRWHKRKTSSAKKTGEVKSTQTPWQQLQGSWLLNPKGGVSGAGKSLETAYGKPAMDYGSKYVNSLAKVKKTTQLSNLKVKKVAVSLVNSKAPMSLKLIGVGVALASDKISNRIVKTTNTMMIKSKMKKK